MPVFKVSGELEKLAREILRIQITVLGDCPQCGGSEYRSGVCEDCAYIADEVKQAIQEWQESQGMPAQPITASKLEVVDALSQLIVMAEKKKDDGKCPRCGSSDFDVSCKRCPYEEPPSELNHRSPEFTGPSPELMKNVKRRFIPSTTAMEKINEQKKNVKHKKKKTKKSSFKMAETVEAEKSQGKPAPEDVKDAESSDITRMKALVRGIAAEDYEQQNATDGQTDDSKEL